MGKLKYLIFSIMVFIFVGCSGIDIPQDKLAYIGSWKGNGMTLLVLGDGSISYKRLENGINKSIDGPIKEFIEDDFVVKVLFLKFTFDVQKPPYLENDAWKMIVDGVELTKVDYLENKSSGKKGK